MKKLKLKRFIKLVCVCLAAASLLQIPASAESYTTYTYSYDARYQVSPHAFTVYGEYVQFDGLELKSPSCVATDSQNRIYISDTGNNRIVIASPDCSSAVSVYSYTHNGTAVNFREPSGICVTENDLIYITDTGNARVVVINPDGSTVAVLDSAPSSAQLGGFAYTPVAVGVDKLERVFILSRDTPGIILMDKTGEFQGVIGAQNVTVNLSDYIWRMFMTREQILNSNQYVPITYNNLCIDEKGFLYVTSFVEDGYSLQQAVKNRSSDSDSAPIKKLTSDGTDVLKRNGFFPPVGDVNFEIKSKSDTNAKTHSSITAVMVRENGIYSLVDSEYGKIFSYDEDGNLLYAFGGTGSTAGLFENLVSVTYQGTNLLALDSGKGSVTVFNMTEYGAMIDKVVDLENSHSYSEVNALWEEILKKNNNFDLAYYSIGQSYLEQGDYTCAMEYFKLINNKTYYSKAFGSYREKLLNKWFILVPLLLAAAVFLTVKLFGAAKKYNLSQRYVSGKRSLGSHLVYSAHTVFHPFDGFSDIKREGRGGVLSATVIFIVAMLSLLLNTLASGYLFKSELSNGLGDVMNALGNVLVPLVLFMLSNWCLTSLMDGKGSMKEIYITICYSLTPMVLLLNLATVLSHCLILEESAFITCIVTVAYAWSIILIFFGTMTIHDYGLGKNIIVTALSVVGIAVMLFLILLFVSVLGKITTFISNIYTEISFRL